MFQNQIFMICETIVENRFKVVLLRQVLFLLQFEIDYFLEGGIINLYL